VFSALALLVIKNNVISRKAKYIFIRAAAFK
jgi:hypothetical protein